MVENQYKTGQYILILFTSIKSQIYIKLSNIYKSYRLAHPKTFLHNSTFDFYPPRGAPVCHENTELKILVHYGLRYGFGAAVSFFSLFISF